MTRVLLGLEWGGSRSMDKGLGGLRWMFTTLPVLGAFVLLS